MGKFDLSDWKQRRQTCRTSLWRLCQVLGYKDVSKTHQPMYRHVQGFVGGDDPKMKVNIVDGAGYKPFVPMWHLLGPRKRLNLITRGGLKTSILTQAHSIQWIINYPDIRILLVSAQLGRAKDFLKGIKEQFTKNQTFRWLFPEFCPKTTSGGHLEDFGNDEQFTVPCRRTPGIKEPTIRVASADSSIAGGHYDVTKVDDLVEDQNTRTPGSIEQIHKFFGSLNPLQQDDPVRPDLKGWVDLTGTIYHFADLHFAIKSHEEKLPEAERQWSVLYIPAASDYGTPKAKPWWPERITLKKLRDIETDPATGPGVLYPQYLLRPLQDKDGLIQSKEDIRWIPRKELDQYAARITWNVTVDLAGMETQAAGDTDYTVINLHGWGSDGRCYFDRIYWGRYSPDEVITILFSVFECRPQIQFIKIEKEAHARVLLPFLRKEESKRQRYLPIMALIRDNKTSKVHRIRGTQPYWKNSAFVFAADLDKHADGVKAQLEMEALYFPKFNHDDILDTVADALRSRDGSITADVEGRAKMEPAAGIQLDGDGSEQTWKGIPTENLSWAALAGAEEEAEVNGNFQPW